jgi:hypothetical protein
VFTELLLRRGLHNPVVPPLLSADDIENSLIYCCILDCVYRAVAWQHVDKSVTIFYQECAIVVVVWEVLTLYSVVSICLKVVWYWQHMSEIVRITQASHMENKSDMPWSVILFSFKSRGFCLMS